MLNPNISSAAELKDDLVNVPEDHFAYNLQRRSRSGCVGRGMPPQIMGTEIHSQKPTGLLDHQPSGAVFNRKNPPIRLDVFSPDIGL